MVSFLVAEAQVVFKKLPSAAHALSRLITQKNPRFPVGAKVFFTVIS